MNQQKQNFILNVTLLLQAAVSTNLDFITYSTPEQNNHAESFHGRLKKEYVRTQEFNSLLEAEKANLKPLETTTRADLT
ncbi:MAG: transposase [Nitrososphaerota archaeon]|nr:transposase [Nitrososphaerota archaeon]